ncbi:MAG: cytochrome c-type biosis protein [Baekduia sp.]|jgi:cytochrome c-type biogenesis protein|nr:cytochrome c-type biosis protein [Baekduia sp.]
MLAAATAATNSVDTTVFAAFAVGFVSFISPCVLPLVPGYLSAISGVTIDEMRGEERPVGKVLGPALIFCLSFTIMFVALGMSATGIGSTLSGHQDTLNRIAGWLIVVLGVFFVSTLFIPRLNRDFRPEALIRRAGAGGPVIAGLAFAVAWTPCVGPTLGSIIIAASTSDTVGKGGVLLACYSLGLAIPFLITAVAFDRATTAFRWLRDRHVLITAVSGAVLIIMGVLILSGELTTLNQKAQHTLSGLGLDFLYNL